MRRMVVTSRYGQLLDDGKRLEEIRGRECGRVRCHTRKVNVSQCESM